MNFGLATFRELIEDFLTNSGGRRGNDREARRNSDEFDGEAASETDLGDGTDGDESSGSSLNMNADAISAAAEDEDDDDDDDDGSGGGGFFSRGSKSDDDIDDLHYRIEELEEELEDKKSELGSVQDSQQHVADQVEEVNERVQQLVGMYDQVTDNVNPFTGEGEAQNGFGVFGEDEMAAEDGPEDDAELGAGIQAAVEATEEDETVSFSDLKGVIEDAAAAQSEGGETITFDEDDAADDTRVEVQATESVDGSDDASDDARAQADADAADGEEGTTDDDSTDVTLTGLADTYATDIIVFEWLTQLVRTGGSAATLRAISYYAEIGWINDDVKEHLEHVLSGPDLDIHVDPGTTPEELTAEDHADSYTYIMKLQEIHETKQEVDPDRSADAASPSATAPGPTAEPEPEPEL
ncbi:FlaD/FlaE family flagellar protein [Natronolimnohabitans innermongolicus]|uniref:Flagella accessory C family protein n=1 Tax=Natronolimnohabitans innermongolicus JCM 12255 TaxID=1227499 RepID=L9WUX7_9EURY|nr:FlaD/FlaE family flagellar protein [Natronolimnohabitans innermongolicus]ELY53222.1 Flagella accessory C family protein [Natronolimnohabitans innermongolicus JCM 12255]